MALRITRGWAIAIAGWLVAATITVGVVVWYVQLVNVHVDRCIDQRVASDKLYECVERLRERR